MEESSNEQIVNQLTQLFDNNMIANGKQSISLKSANQIVKLDSSLININLKKLLEDGKFQQAYQTQQKPRQWIINFSTPADYLRFRNEYLLSHPELKTNISYVYPGNGNNQNTGLIVGITFAIILIIVFVFYFNNGNKNNYAQQESETQYQENNENNNSINQNINSSEQSLPEKYKGIRFKFKSTYYDIEKNYEIIKTNHETTYAVFDFQNMVIKMDAQMDEERITFTYPIVGCYIEKGYYTNYVFTINSLGVNEIWWSPGAGNFGIDYMDGTRIACYGMKSVE